jgi:DNA repair protein RecN (Recombination protein N)
MLRTLAIRNFAIINELDLRLEAGFTAITGETGAGKSILVDALGLLLGDRAESSLVAPGCKQAELAASFTLEGMPHARDWLEEQAMEEDDELLLRRVISADGRSRAWINGRSATIGQLGELGALLVEIHGQHEHQQLEKPDSQRRLLDSEIPADQVSAVARAFSDWRAARAELERFEQDAGDPDQLELLRFQCRELDELNLLDGEFDELEKEQERLSRSDDIRLAAGRATAALDQDEAPSVRGLLHEALHELGRVGEFEPRLAEAAGMLEEARINIDEAFAVVERVGEEESGDPARLSEVNRRLEKSLDLARKHRIEPGELPALATALSARLDRLEHQGERRGELEGAVETAELAWRKHAGALSAARAKAARSLSARACECLAELGMDQASLAFRVTPDAGSAPTAHGLDRIAIEFSANPGQPPRPLAKVASGGELSRVALALMIACGHRQGPHTRIFDEVDAGVGGETAHAVGRFLCQAAGEGQALCVTHLAQVAACADHQMRVIKCSENGATTTRIEQLGAEARKTEIARMLGNADSTTSLAHAEEMLRKGGIECEV